MGFAYNEDLKWLWGELFESVTVKFADYRDFFQIFLSVLDLQRTSR